MNKHSAFFLVILALALSACGASTPVSSGLMMSAPGDNGAHTVAD